ncbi:MAG: alpha/beta hydrolase [Alphaproteobacteria bacterium]|nr:alpha/beta hydrolase [Alphaproteobacteria bacterium]
MPNRLTTFLASLAGLLASACTPAALLNATVPDSGYTVHKDIAYGTHPRQKLDVYVPDTPTPNADVIVFYYGGTWNMGDKADFKFVGQALASQHFITVIADYRLYPEIRYPTFLQDNALAFKWAHDHIAEFGGNPQNLFIAGHSAGAYNAMMLTVNGQFLKDVGGERGWIRGTIGIAGPYDFLPFTDPKIINTFSTEEDWKTQPVNYIDAPQPPMLLAHGLGDKTVSPKNSVSLAEKVRRYGSPVTLKEYDGVTHIGIVLSLARGFRYKSPLLEDITAFVGEHSAAKQ